MSPTIGNGKGDGLLDRMISEGRLYFVRDFADVVFLTTPITYMMFRTPATGTIHARVSMDAESEFEVSIFRGPTLTAPGAPIVPQNANQNSARPHTLLPFAGPTVTADGTKIWSAKLGSGKNATGVSPGFGYDIQAKRSTDYLFKIQKIATATHWINWDFFWYET